MDAADYKEGPPFTCSHCGASFGWKSACKRHVRTLHTEEREFPCTHCNASFGAQVNLTAHQNKLHKEVKNRNASTSTTRELEYPKTGCPSKHCLFPCIAEGCTWSFSQEISLLQHVLRHAEQDWECAFETCEEWFQTSEGMLQHLKSHDTLLSGISSSIILLAQDEEEHADGFIQSELSLGNTSQNLLPSCYALMAAIREQVFLNTQP